MRIVIDMQGAQSESRFRGIGRYSLSLAKALADIKGEHELLIALNGGFSDTIEPIRQAFEGLLSPRDIRVWHAVGPIMEKDPWNEWRRLAAEKIRLCYLQDLAPDALIISSFLEGYVDNVATSIEPGCSVPITAAIVYDLIPLLNPEKYLVDQGFKKHYQRKLAQLRRADLFMAISESARREAIEQLTLDPGNTVNISAAVDPMFRKLEVPPQRAASLRARLQITGPFVMYTGGMDWRKNLPRLIRAFAALPATVRGQHQLVLVGWFPPGGADAIGAIAKACGLPPAKFLMTGYVTDEELVDLYNLCTGFVFPSWHEGFGLPVLEAMACGSPAICSNTTSLPEVLDRADAQFDPFDEDDVRSLLLRLLTDEEFRGELSRYGLQRATLFSWKACACKTLTALEARFKANNPIRSEWRSIWSSAKAAQRDLVESIGRLSARDEPDERDLCRVAASIHANHREALASHRSQAVPHKGIAWRIEGPFDSSYSLALLNRETARALDSMDHRVVLHSTEGPGDFEPNLSFLLQNDDLARMHSLANAVAPEDALVTSRNLYPPRVSDMRSRFNLLHHFAWEEAGFPASWVEDFNEHLQAITCLSNHVEKILVDHGVTVPLVTSGCGVDHWGRITPEPGFRPPGRAFRFLHVSSCFPRKGADSLLRAYGNVFSRTDDVTLVVKTFPNPHNVFAQTLELARAARSDFPDVVLIAEDWTDARMKALYESCDVLVAPSRAEGFGLPLAEAMLSGLAVITTGWGGQLDFCTNETAWLVDYEFGLARTHMQLPDSVWAEPDVEDLGRVMRKVYSLDGSARRNKADRGRELLMQTFRWTQVAHRLVRTVQCAGSDQNRTRPRIGWISSWNARCGIAEYSRHLIESMPDDIRVFASRASAPTSSDGPRVLRSWEQDNLDDLRELHGQVDASGVDTLVVQFSYAFFDFNHLARFLNDQIDARRTVVVMLHATVDQIVNKPLGSLCPALSRCDRLLVHSAADLNRLKALGLVKNVALFPHGVVDRPPLPASPGTSQAFRLASYGFLLPHKGLSQLVDALAILRQSGRDVVLTMVNAEYPAHESRRTIDQLKSKIQARGLVPHVRLVTAFLPDSESFSLLEAVDLIVFPYQETGESSSAAVRTGLAAGRPVAVTPIAIFDDVATAVFKLPGCAPPEIAAGIGQLMDTIRTNGDLAQQKSQQANAWRNAHRHSYLGPRLYRTLQALHAKRNVKEPISTMDSKP